jgi:hypothetical protein
MSFVVRFTPPSLSTQQYDEIIKRLEEAGAGSPRGRLYAVAFGPHDALRVSDVWDTRENFDRFAQTLMPLLQELGIDPGTPELIDVYNIIPGSGVVS